MSKLSEALEFHHVLAVHADGSFTDGKDTEGIYAPEAYDVDPMDTELDGWTLPLSGFTGQHGYKGPWLHDSEIIEGGVEEYILSHPGYWVAIYSSYTPECPEGFESCPCREELEADISGWTMAFKPFSA